MAKLVSAYKMRGTVDGMTFRKTEFGFEAGEKSGLTDEKVLTDEDFNRSRQNAHEFKYVTHDARLLRRSLGDVLWCVRRTSLNGHVIGLVNKGAKEDTENGLGFRRAGSGDLSLLKGFDFSKTLTLDEAMPRPFTSQFSLENGVGTVRLTVPAFIARRKKSLFPAEATHMRIVSCASLIGFHHNGFALDVQASDLLPFARKTPGAICLEHRIRVEEGEVLLQAMAIEFYRVENGNAELLKGGAVRILDVAQRPFLTVPQKKVTLQTPMNADGAGAVEEELPLVTKSLLQRPLPGFHGLPGRVLPLLNNDPDLAVHDGKLPGTPGT